MKKREIRFFSAVLVSAVLLSGATAHSNEKVKAQNIASSQEDYMTQLQQLSDEGSCEEFNRSIMSNVLSEDLEKAGIGRLSALLMHPASPGLQDAKKGCFFTNNQALAAIAVEQFVSAHETPISSKRKVLFSTLVVPALNSTLGVNWLEKLALAAVPAAADDLFWLNLSCHWNGSGEPSPFWRWMEGDVASPRARKTISAGITVQQRTCEQNRSYDFSFEAACFWRKIDKAEFPYDRKTHVSRIGVKLVGVLVFSGRAADSISVAMNDLMKKKVPVHDYRQATTPNEAVAKFVDSACDKTLSNEQRAKLARMESELRRTSLSALLETVAIDETK